MKKIQEIIRQSLNKDELDKLIDFKVDLEDKQLSKLKSLMNSKNKNIGYLMEVTHLVMRFIHPELKDVKFTKSKFDEYIFDTSGTAKDLMNDLDYSRISQKIFKEVKKRF